MKRFVSLALGAAIVSAAAAPLNAAEIRVGFTLDALTLDPANHRKRETETIIRNMYDGVLTRDAKMAIVPELAESYKQVDATTYEFKLRTMVTKVIYLPDPEFQARASAGVGAACRWFH